MDDNNYFTYVKENGYEFWPFDESFHLLLNIAVGGTWGGQEGINESIFPQQLLIDWVRVWEIDQETFPEPTLNTISSILPTQISNNEHKLCQSPISIEKIPFFIKSVAHSMFLGSTPDKRVDTTNVKLGWQKWCLVMPSAGSNFCCLRSHDHNFFLTSVQRKVFTSNEIQSTSYWKLIMDKNKENGLLIKSKEDGLHLGSTPDRNVDTTDVKLGWQKWEISSIAIYLQTIGKSPTRYLGSTPDRLVDGATVSEGWQIWKLIVVNCNTYFLQSDVHGLYLGSTNTYKVDTTDVCQGWQQWELVNLQPRSKEGAVYYLLRSISHNTWICMSKKGKVSTSTKKTDAQKFIFRIQQTN